MTKQKSPAEKSAGLSILMTLIDKYNRQIDYLRISITDRCNLRCSYCMPAGINLLPRDEVLRFEEILRIARIAVEAGIKKIRITGGEPLIRRNIIEFISNLSKLSGLEDLALTTNGQNLADLALSLKNAGLKRINVSLDSLNPDRYFKLTGGGKLDNVLKGLEATQNAGLLPVKINMVVLEGINEDEILNFAELALKNSWEVRFIELRPHSPIYPGAYFPIKKIWEIINKKYPLKVKPTPFNSTSKQYSFDNALGTLGFIGKAEDDLCENCNRLRLTASGKLYPCLFSTKFFDIKKVLRDNSSDDQILSLLKEATQAKPARFLMPASPAPMFKIGG